MGQAQWGNGYYKGLEDGKQKSGIIGQFFHTFKNGTLDKQGVIEDRINNDVYLVTFFSWFDGSDNGNKTVHLNDMEGWIFYNTSDAMKQAWDNKYKQIFKEQLKCSIML